MALVSSIGGVLWVETATTTPQMEDITTRLQKLVSINTPSDLTFNFNGQGWSVQIPVSRAAAKILEKLYETSSTTVSERAIVLCTSHH